jgi:sigma-E factor negative regulatory protein RseB
MIGDDHPVKRAAQRFVLVVGAGALGAAVCSTGVRYAGPDDDETLRTLRTGSVPSAREITPDEAAALTVLRRAAAAEKATSYEGQKVFGSWSAAGGESVLAEVGHTPGRGTWVRVASASGHSPRRRDRAEIADAGGDLDPQALALLTDQYRLQIAEPGRCIGRKATVVEATPIGGDRVAGRFWVDDDSGLLLRRELYDANGHAVRSTVFLDLRVDEASADPQRTVPATFGEAPARIPSPRSTRSERLLDESELIALRTEGWILPDVLPGGLLLYRARAVDVHDGEDAVHLTYSDGLFSLSLFAQRGRLDASALHGFEADELGGAAVYRRSGLYRQVVWASDDTVYTLVSDAPDDELAQVVGVLPHDKPGAGLRARVGRGIDRMGSWINPFA